MYTLSRHCLKAGGNKLRAALSWKYNAICTSVFIMHLQNDPRKDAKLLKLRLKLRHNEGEAKLVSQRPSHKLELLK